jgi:hypothetical protein
MKQCSTTDEHHNFRTSFNSRDDKNVGLYGKSCGEDGEEDKVATPEVNQRGGDFNPLPT